MLLSKNTRTRVGLWKFDDLLGVLDGFNLTVGSPRYYIRGTEETLCNLLKPTSPRRKY